MVIIRRKISISLDTARMGANSLTEKVLFDHLNGIE